MNFKDPTHIANLAAAAAEMATIPNRAHFSTGAADMTCFVERGPARVSFDGAVNTLSYNYRVVFVLDQVEYDFPLTQFLKDDHSRKLSDTRELVKHWAKHPTFPHSLVVQRFGDIEAMLNNIRIAVIAMQKEVGRIHQKHNI